MELKAILSEDLNVLYEYIFADSSEVKLLRAANVKWKIENRSLISKEVHSKQQKAEFINRFWFLRNEFLSLEHSVLLQHLKIVFLIRGMLVDHEDVRVEFGDDEAQVELTDDLHLFEHVFAVWV